jgi:hypothetical protein
VDLLQILRKIWRYRIVTLPVLALTLLGAIYVVALKDSEYSANSSYVLINPPGPPTAEEIAADPKLGRISADNPYTRFADQSTVVDLLASSLSNESARRALAQQGADSRYKVAPSSQFGYAPSLIVDITGVGSTPEIAMGTASLVGAALTAELDRLQASQGVDPRYRIEAQRVVAPDHAEQQLSGKLRTLVGVFVLGGILLFVAVSAAEGLTALRAERRGHAKAEGRDGGILVPRVQERQVVGNGGRKGQVVGNGGRKAGRRILGLILGGFAAGDVAERIGSDKDVTSAARNGASIDSAETVGSTERGEQEHGSQGGAPKLRR